MPILTNTQPPSPEPQQPPPSPHHQNPARASRHAPNTANTKKIKQSPPIKDEFSPASINLNWKLYWKYRWQHVMGKQ